MGRVPSARANVPPKRSAPTIYDVAREANVSSQTVSRFFNGFEGIRPSTRERVEAAASMLGYSPNLTARLLSTNRSHRIGALAHELSEAGGGRVVEAASAAAAEAGYLLDIISLDVHDNLSVKRAIALINQNELAGIIAFAPTDGLIAALDPREFSVPVLVAASPDDRYESDQSNSDGAAQALLVEYLVGLGHTRFAYVAGPQGWISSRSRELAYHQTLTAHAIRSVLTITGDWSAASGYSAGVQLASRRDVTAIVVANDQMALGVMRALWEADIPVPGEISVVGFDDIPEARYFSPSLTTVSHDFSAQGRIAVERLLAQITGEPRPSASAPFHSLVIRESSGRPRLGSTPTHDALDEIVT